MLDITSNVIKDLIEDNKENTHYVFSEYERGYVDGY